MSPYLQGEPPPRPSIPPTPRIATHIAIAGWMASGALGLLFGILLSIHFDHPWLKVVALGLLCFAVAVVWVVSIFAAHWIRTQAHLSVYLVSVPECEPWECPAPLGCRDGCKRASLARAIEQMRRSES